ncbi:MAG: hypothetical protein AB7P04_00890 [Bacteriovoracia bacterium]
MKHPYLFFLFLSLLGGTAGGSEPAIHIHLGSLRENKIQLRQEEFLDPLPTSITTEKGDVVQVIVHVKPTADDVISTLQDPNTLGWMWAGESALDIPAPAAGEKARIRNSFLQTVSGRYLPASLFSATHPGEIAIGISTCHNSALAKKYAPALPVGLALLQPQALAFESEAIESAAILSFDDIFEAPREVFDQISAQVVKMPRPVPAMTGPKTTVQIEYRNQNSNRFDYEVLLDGKLIGVLEKTVDSEGLTVNKNIKEFQIDTPAPGQSAVLTIRPDEWKRAGVEGNLRTVTPLLVDSVKIAGQERLSQVIHLGDESPDPKLPTARNLSPNQPEIRRLPVQAELRVEWKP